ncbi:MAG TPA: helix-turn-helix transcriptional regulator [Steroidobacteraceae bacterium]|nr:helix-turn-helix transcriptional regulator [Steroidobacteraceae bacterium]
MAERDLIVAELKRALREKGLTYATVAQKLELSVATVKRLFSSGDFSLHRVDLICELLGIGWREILERAHDHTTPVNQLTLTQEQEIVSDPKLLFVTWLVINRAPFEEIVATYRFSKAELQRLLIRLDRLKVIELQPMNRVRLLVSRRFSWRAAGPVHRYIHQKLLREFLESSFSAANEEFFFHGALVSEESLALLKRTLRAASQECLQIFERDRSTQQDGRGCAFLLAVRPWTYSGFKQFER